MSNLLKKPKAQLPPDDVGRYDPFDLTENPFPTEPVNRDSSDRRINGEIYETEIRTIEFLKIEESFLKKPQSDRNRLRLGYICDTSYIGRGNGKSAFLVNLAQRINKNFCMDISDDMNKCFAIYVSPEPGGRTKTFPAFLDQVFEAMFKSGIFDTCLAMLRLQAINDLNPEHKILSLIDGIDTLVINLNSAEWLQNQGVDLPRLTSAMLKNEHLMAMNRDFPLLSGTQTMFGSIITSDQIIEHYRSVAKRGREKHEFILSQLVYFFMAAGFNGAYLLVDDFERIPDFQSGRQRRDFAIELRTAMLDGPYVSARTGFYSTLLVLHAGVPQLVSEAWSASGLENRYPITPRIEYAHWIAFEKLTKKHVSLLLKKYLDAYRKPDFKGEGLNPFTSDAVELIAEINENNAAKILRFCWDLLEKAAEEEKILIDKAFVVALIERQGQGIKESSPTIEDPTATDLMKKAIEGQG